jgi:glycine amidinotransferase
VHRIEFGATTPTHIDTTLVPVRPGLVLVNPQWPCTNGALERFIANDWRVVEAPPSVRSGRSHAADVSSGSRSTS